MRNQYPDRRGNRGPQRSGRRYRDNDRNANRPGKPQRGNDRNPKRRIVRRDRNGKPRIIRKGGARRDNRDKKADDRDLDRELRDYWIGEKGNKADIDKKEVARQKLDS